MKTIKFLALNSMLIVMLFSLNGCEDLIQGHQRSTVANKSNVRYVSEQYAEYLWVQDDFLTDIDKDITYRTLYFRDEDPKYLLGTEFYVKDSLYQKTRFINEGKIQKQVGVSDKDVRATIEYLDDARTMPKEEYTKSGTRTKYSYDDKNRIIGILVTSKDNLVVREEVSTYGDSISYREIKHYSKGKLQGISKDTIEYYDADCKKKRLEKVWFTYSDRDVKEYTITEYEYGVYGETKIVGAMYSVVDSCEVEELTSYVELITWIDELNSIAVVESYSGGVKAFVSQTTTRFVK